MAKDFGPSVRPADLRNPPPPEPPRPDAPRPSRELEAYAAPWTKAQVQHARERLKTAKGTPLARLLPIPEDSKLNLMSQDLDPSVMSRHEGEDPFYYALCLEWLELGGVHQVDPNLIRLGARTRERWEDFCNAVARREGIDPERLTAHLTAAREAFRWYARAKFHDAAVARKATEVSLEALDDMRKRYLSMTHNMHVIARNELIKLQAKSEGSDLPALDAKELTKLIELATKTELLVRGQATENVKVSPGVDLSKLSDSELEQYRALLEKAEGR